MMSQATLGIDVGSVRIGVAICEAPDLPSVPLTTIIHTNRKADIEAILKLALERNATRIVVGNPIRMDGTIGPAAEKVGTFVRDLRAGFAGEVIEQDERFTTAAAARRLRDLPISGSKRRRRVDELAAVEILDAFFARGPR